jgi:hypothetical protein
VFPNFFSWNTFAKARHIFIFTDAFLPACLCVTARRQAPGMIGGGNFLWFFDANNGFYAPDRFVGY